MFFVVPLFDGSGYTLILGHSEADRLTQSLARPACVAEFGPAPWAHRVSSWSESLPAAWAPTLPEFLDSPLRVGPLGKGRSFFANELPNVKLCLALRNRSRGSQREGSRGKIRGLLNALPDISAATDETPIFPKFK